MKLSILGEESHIERAVLHAMPMGWMVMITTASPELVINHRQLPPVNNSADTAKIIFDGDIPGAINPVFRLIMTGDSPHETATLHTANVFRNVGVGYVAFMVVEFKDMQEILSSRTISSVVNSTEILQLLKP